MATRQREKAEKYEATRDKRPTAIAKNIRISTDKVKVVLDLIRNKPYEEAVNIMKHTNKSSCDPILKVLESAGANAENNLNLSKDNLYVAHCWAMNGPTMKRMMPRARGRADRILKRTSHIRIILGEISTKGTAKKSEGKVKASTTTATKATSAPKAKTTSAKPAAKTAPKQVPVTKAERPLTDTPNAKKPLGAKPVTAPKAAPKKEEVK